MFATPIKGDATIMAMGGNRSLVTPRSVMAHSTHSCQISFQGRYMVRVDMMVKSQEQWKPAIQGTVVDSKMNNIRDSIAVVYVAPNTLEVGGQVGDRAQPHVHSRGVGAVRGDSQEHHPIRQDARQEDGQTVQAEAVAADGQPEHVRDRRYLPDLAPERRGSQAVGDPLVRGPECQARVA